MSCSFGLPYVLIVFLIIVILVVLVLVIQVITHFGFEGGTLVLIASVPSNCLSFTFCDQMSVKHSDAGQSVHACARYYENMSIK